MIFTILFSILLCICFSLLIFFHYSFLKHNSEDGVGERESTFMNSVERLAENKKVAVIKCSHIRENQKHKLQHYKMIDCRIYLDKYGQDGFCKYGCLGYGTCAAVCPESAIILKNGTAIVTDKCTGCGICVSSCPQKIIEIINPNKDLIKQCSLPLNEKNDECSASCISCGKCDSKDFKLEYCPHMCIKKSPIIVNKGFKFWEFCYKIFHKDEISK